MDHQSNSSRYGATPLLLCLLLLISITSVAQEKKPGDKIWKFKAGNKIQKPPTLGPDGNIYFASWDYHLYALDANTGGKKWVVNVGGTHHPSTPAIGTNGYIYIAASNHIYAFDSETGDKKWGFQTGKYVTSSPAIGADGTIYVGSHSPVFYALNGETGEQIWQKSNDLGSGNSNWVEASAAVSSDGFVYFGVQARRFLGLDNQTGDTVFSFKTNGGIYSSPAIGDNGLIYFGSKDDHKVFALNRLTGEKKWEFETGEGGSVRSSPAIGVDGTIYIGAHDKKVYALNGETGVKKWEFVAGAGTMSSPAVDADGTVYIGSDDKKVYALDGKTGVKKWEFLTGDRVFSSPVISPDGIIYIGSNDNYLYALKGSSGPADSPWPMFGQNPQRTGMAPTAPTIMSLTVPKVVSEGSKAILQVEVKGHTPFTYQWFKNDRKIKARIFKFVIDPAQQIDSGQYSVVVTNQYGSVTSETVEMKVIQPIAPTITSQPQSVAAKYDQSLELTVDAEGTEPFRYQWNKNGKAIKGALSSSLIIDPVKDSDAGEYSVLVLNDGGAAVSDTATVTVVSPISIASSSIDGNGNLIMEANGPINSSVMFQYSEDLIVWTDQFTLPLVNGKTTFKMPTKAAQKLFYRLKLAE
jgi:outer membrane protein assembly factor BamB